MYHNATNSTTHPPHSNNAAFYRETVASSVVLALFSPVAVTVNALVLAAIWRNPLLRTPSYIFLTGLALTDFCSGLIGMPISVANGLIYLTEPQMNLRDANTWPTSYLKTRVIVDVCGSYLFHVTILTMTLMSIERWLHMTRRSLITVRRACFAVAVLLLTPVPSFIYVIQGTFTSTFSIISLSILLVCLTTTSVCYFKVFRIIRRHQQQIHANELSQNVQQPAINIQKYKKSVFTILYILVVFYISYLPTIVALALFLVLPINEFTFWLLTVTAIFFFSSSLLNPLLYFWRMSDIRNEVRDLVRKMFCRDS